MWQTIFRISDGAVTKHYDLLDVIFTAIGWLVVGVSIGLDMPIALTLLLAGAVAIVYLLTSAIIFYIRRLCFEQVEDNDPLYWEHHR